LSDANFLALYLVVGLPFLWFSISLKKGPMKTALCLMMIPMLAGMSRTGSRMGLLALGAGLLLFFIFATAKEKAAIIMGGSLFLILALVLLPEKIVQRFTTFFNPTSAAGLEAAQSTNSRKVLLKRGIDLSLEHPLLGVGPGQFMVAEAEEAAAVGRRGVWHYTHNSYTELSSETGVMGLFLFMFALYKSYKGMTPIRNGYPNVRVRRAALFLQVAVLMTSIGAFFLSIAYSGIVYVILGLSAAFQVAVRDEMRLRKAQAREALP
jgi:O-antigen ligase